MMLGGDTRNKAFVFGTQKRVPGVRLGTPDAMTYVSAAELKDLFEEVDLGKKIEDIFPIENYVDSILMRARVKTEIPECSKPLWARCLFQTLDLVRRFPASERAWALLMSLEFLLLQKPCEERSRGNSKRTLHARLLRFQNWEIEELLGEAERQWLVNSEVMSARPQKREGGSGPTIRSDQLFRNGRFGDALKEIALNGGGLRKESSQESEDLIQEKVKQRPLPDINTFDEWRKIRNSQGFEAVTMTKQEFAKIFGAVDKSRGPGLSGLSYAQMSDALQVPEMRDKLLECFADVCSLLASAQVPKKLWPYWFGGRGGISGKDGRRLFVAGESLQKLTERHMIRVVLEKVGAKNLFKYNVGVGIRGGADYVGGWAENVVRNHGDKKGLVFLEVDAHNMFLELVRSRVLQIVRDRVPQLYPLVMHLTSPMFVSLFRGQRCFEITHGISIGSAASSLIASLVGEVLLERLNAKVEEWKATRNDVWLDKLAYIDNVFMATEEQHAPTILKNLEVLGEELGLKYKFRQEHPHKISFVNARNNSGPAILSKHGLENVLPKFRGFDVSVMSDLRDPAEQGIVLAGVPFGTIAFHKAVWNKQLEKVLRLGAILFNGGIHPKEAVILVRKCLVLKMGFLARMAPPGAIDDEGRQFDNYILHLVQCICEGHGDWAADTPTRRWIQISWGLGVLEHSLIPARLAKLTLNRQNGLEIDLNQVTQQIGVFNSRVKEGDRFLGEDVKKTLAKLEKLGKVQKQLTSMVWVRQEELLKESLADRPRDLRLWEAVKAKGASLWRDRPCFDGVLDPTLFEKSAMSPEGFKMAVRRWMPGKNVHGLPAKQAEKMVCMAKAANGNICNAEIRDGILDHPEVLCPCVRGGAKHTALQLAVCKLCVELGVTAKLSQLEPIAIKHQEFTGKAKVHADVKVTGIHRLPIVIDVANKSRMANGGAPVGFLEAEERKKTERYCAVYWKGGELFTPFVTGAHSEEGSRCWELVNLLANRLYAVQGTPVAKGRRRIRAFFQCVVQEQISRNALRFVSRHEKEIQEERMRISDEAKVEEVTRVMKEVHRRVEANHAAGMAVNGVPPEIGSPQYQAWFEERERTREVIRAEETKRRAEGLDMVRADLARRAALARTIPPGMGMGAAGRK